MDSLPKSPAGRLQAVMGLLCPMVPVTCTHCGSVKMEPGEPLISKEDAIKLLDLPDIATAGK